MADIRNLATKLYEEHIFQSDQQKHCESFKKFNAETLSKLDMDKLLLCAKRKQAEFELIYNRR